MDKDLFRQKIGAANDLLRDEISKQSAVRDQAQVRISVLQWRAHVLSVAANVMESTYSIKCGAVPELQIVQHQRLHQGFMELLEKEIDSWS